jgi:outer membrane protein TolC
VHHPSLSLKPDRVWALTRAVCFGFAVAMLSSCVVGPKAKTPLPDLKPFHNGDAAAARAVTRPTPPLDSWWTGFDDPELTKIIKRALAQNLDLAASVSRIEQARAAAKAAGAKLKPSTSLSAQSSSFRQSLESPVGRYATLFPGFDRNQSYLDLGVAATWEIDLFGGLRRGVEAATEEVQVAEAERLGTLISVAAEAGDAYMQIRSAQLRLESQLNRLDVLMGSQPGTYASELTAVHDIPPVPAIAGFTQLSELMRRRPDIIAAEHRVTASNARIGQALADYYPKLSLSALLGNEAINVGDLFREKTFQPTAIAGLRWRLFDFGRVDAEVKQAKGANTEAIARYRSAVLQAAEDVEDSLFALVHLEARQNDLSQEIGSLQRVRDRSQEAYQAGVIPLTDVLDADRQLLVARDDLASTRENAARAAIASFRALGGGWRP